MGFTDSFDPTADGPSAVDRLSIAPASTYLAPGSSMEGTLKVRGDVEIAGSFNGTLLASGSVLVRSNLQGDIQAGQLQLVSCSVIGDLHGTDTVLLDSDCRVKGNIFARQLHCDGKVAGDLKIDGSAAFGQDAEIEGNITTRSMSVECGACIKGSVTMMAEKADQKTAKGDISR